MYRTRVIDEDGNEAKAGEPGELVILPHDGKGYPVGVFVGYFKDEKMYANVWRNGVYHSKVVDIRSIFQAIQKRIPEHWCACTHSFVCE